MSSIERENRKNPGWSIQAVPGLSICYHSTFAISLHLPPSQTISKEYPSIRAGLKRLWGNIIGFFHGLLFVILYLFVFGIPIVLIGGVLYYTCFGKLGLIKRFFVILSSKEKKRSK